MQALDKEQAIRRLRRRLLTMMAGLTLSYAISFGVATYLFYDAGVFASDLGWPIIIGFAVLAFFHVRGQFRRYDRIVRLAETSDED